MKNKLYLASGSYGRKGLLESAKINFLVVEHNADESECCRLQSLESVVMQTAQLKMDHVILPKGHEGKIIFVLTADTMSVDSLGIMHGKPESRDEAKKMIRSFRNGATVGTAFCLEKKIWRSGLWQTEKKLLVYEKTECIFDVPENFLDFYLDNIPFLDLSGGVSIEGIGEQFLKEVHGNYATIVGLPMFTLRQALFDFGFYEQ